jgi:hypothetical protein
MDWSEIPRNPSPATLRRFALLWLVVFAGAAAWQAFGPGNLAPAALLLGLALGVGLAGVVSPRRVRWLFVGSTMLTFPAGWLVSHLLLALLFYGVLTPLGLIFRLARRDPLTRRFDPSRESYWTTKPAQEDVRSYFRQG